MFRGFYNLASGMLSQGRRLDVVASNITNVSTPGYKADHYTDSTFREEIISRVGNKDKSAGNQLGVMSYMLAPSQLYTDLEQAALEETGLPLDFAIEGEGFFAVETGQGRIYTRAGNFSLDEGGYLCLPGQGRVLDPAGEPIELRTDKITANANGEIYSEAGAYLGSLGVYTFPEDGQPTRDINGQLTTGTEPVASEANVQWKMLERSNVDLVRQLTQMMTSQRALQSAAQVSKMYDQVIMNKAANDLGRI